MWLSGSTSKNRHIEEARIPSAHKARDEKTEGKEEAEGITKDLKNDERDCVFQFVPMSSMIPRYTGILEKNLNFLSQ